MIARTAIIKGLGLASATFPNYPVTKEMVEAYAALLDDLEVSEEQFIDAVARVLKSQQFYPTVHAIRQELITENFILSPSNAIAWREILDKRDARREQVKGLQQISSGTEEWDAYKSSHEWASVFQPVWSHQALADTIRTLGGWNEVYQILEENKGIPTFRSQLWKIYEEYAHASDRLVYLGKSSNRKELE